MVWKAALMTDDARDGEKPPGPQLVPKDAGKKGRKRLTSDDRLNNFCKAIAEQELFESGAFPNAKEAGDVREELEKMDREFAEEEAERRRKAFTVVRKPREL
jgi:hypothetical protein